MTTKPENVKNQAEIDTQSSMATFNQMEILTNNSNDMVVENSTLNADDACLSIAAAATTNNVQRDTEENGENQAQINTQSLMAPVNSIRYSW